MRFGLDYLGTLTAAAHKAVGSSFACRYLRDLTRNEVNALHSGGIDLVAIHERAAQEALGGRQAGRAAAQTALAEARNCGRPSGRPIYFAVDFDETPGQAGTVADYFRGVHDVFDSQGAASFPELVPVGAYGGYWVIKRLFDEGLIKYGWQTYAWSGGQWDSRAQLQQFSNDHTVGGVGVDYDHAVAEDFGQWFYKPAPPPAPKPEGQAHATLSFDVSNGQWTLQPLPGKVVWQPQERWASLEVQVGAGGKISGQWRTKPLPWNADPLGG